MAHGCFPFVYKPDIEDGRTRTCFFCFFFTFIILPVCCQQIIYDIGTNILFVQCFVTTDVFLFCKPVFFSGICRMFRDLAFGSVKTRFKGFWNIFSKMCMRPWIRKYRFYWTFAPGGRLNYEAYNVDTKA